MFKTIYAVGVLANYIIGVGMFSLPYIASKVGIWTMLGYFLLLGVFVILINLFYGELALRAPDQKRLPGLAKFYLGSAGEKIAAISTIFSFYGAILAYLIIGGEFLQNLLSPIFGGGNLVYTLLYFSLGAILIFYGRKFIFQVEFLGLILFFVILIFIFWRGFPLLKIENLFIKTGNIGDFFLPFGPVLFSLWGLEIIPEIEEFLGKGKSLLRKIIFFGSAIPLFIYLFFIFMVLGISGFQTTESAISGLKSFLGSGVISLAFILGILTTFTSFNCLGLNLKSVFYYDLKINKNLAWAITCFFPLFLFLVGIKSFILVISLAGGTMLAISGILVLLMYRKITKNKFIYPLILIFFIGVVYEFVYFLK
jgi:tyrosine-specific transport protein